MDVVVVVSVVDVGSRRDAAGRVGVALAVVEVAR